MSNTLRKQAMREKKKQFGLIETKEYIKYEPEALLHYFESLFDSDSD